MSLAALQAENERLHSLLDATKAEGKIEALEWAAAHFWGRSAITGEVVGKWLRNQACRLREEGK